MKATYDYHPSGGYATTVARMPDGRTMTVDTQYSVVLPHGEHSRSCPQLTRIGGRCDCGLLDGIDIPALVVDARVNGKFGRRPPEPAPPAAEDKPDNRSRSAFINPVCPRCHTYCFGDCSAV